MENGDSQNVCVATLVSGIGGINFNDNLREYRKKLGFFDLKGDLSSIIDDISYKKSNQANYLDKSTQMSIYQNNNIIGILGAVNSVLREKYDIVDEIFYFELFQALWPPGLL